MEESALRIAQRLENGTDVRVIGYVMRPNESNSEPPRITACVDLDRQVRSMAEVLGIRAEHLPIEHWTRAQIFFMRAAIGKSLRDHLTDRHVLLSFYIPTAGFVGQHIACDLQLPHIACSRGSDLGHALFMQKQFAAIAFVLSRATHVVTTNSEHKRLIGNVCGRRHGVQTIYNGFATTLQTMWQPSRREHVKIVSPGGYCIKKGTHLLLEAVGLLIDEGLPIELEIVGPTRLGSWDSLRQKYTARYGPRVKLNDWIPQSELISFLKAGDIFCSASISEGCPNAALLALGLGMPIVSTRTGALPDLASSWSHVEFVEVGDVSELARGLRNAVNKIRTGKMVVAQDEVQRLLTRLCPEAEDAHWRDLLMKVADYYRPSIHRGGRPIKPPKRL
jgi:glycosyltransferase involved in cell wall biosynthesis